MVTKAYCIEAERGALQADGFAWMRGAVAPEAVMDLGTRLDKVKVTRRSSRASGAGLRIDQEIVEELLGALRRVPELRTFLAAELGGRPLVVRALFFDKSSTARWFVKWHRDTMIPVQEHLPSTELTAPSIKEGVRHVRASARILANMLSIRLHLDPMTTANGPLCIVPGSHNVPNLAGAPDFDATFHKPQTCRAGPGDLLLMRPLLLHSSPKPMSADRRRILHLELSGSASLPDGHSFDRPVPFFDAS